ncbi:ribonuclease H [Trifolium pratense]|uniref:Ribonuclease H n=1 Tax=Trifolium pratense TaxID=57577 RepID=A0A2K3JNS8_TRIPR|nr:ribonuclease H [Trifolium pratense]
MNQPKKSILFLNGLENQIIDFTIFQVVKKVIRIQREFLWGGVKGGRKISWKTVCREKKDGGLSVRDVRVVNFSLLTKWRWRLLQDAPALWKEVLVAKYGRELLYSVTVTYSVIPGVRIASNWWKEICAIEGLVESKNWFSEAITRRIHNRASLFWKQVWLGEATLAVVNGTCMSWNFIWRRRLFIWESVAGSYSRGAVYDRAR